MQGAVVTELSRLFSWARSGAACGAALVPAEIRDVVCGRWEKMRVWPFGGTHMCALLCHR